MKGSKRVGSRQNEIHALHETRTNRSADDALCGHSQAGEEVDGVSTSYYVQGTPRPADASPGVAPSDDRVPGQEEYNILYRDYPPCPEAEPAAGAADTPGAFAARFWSGSVCRCPSPTLASPRAEALTEAT